MSDHTTTGSISPFDYDGAVAMLATLTEERDAALARASGAEAAAADLKAHLFDCGQHLIRAGQSIGEVASERDDLRARLARARGALTVIAGFDCENAGIGCRVPCGQCESCIASAALDATAPATTAGAATAGEGGARWLSR